MADTPVAYLLTWSCHGTWLHGDTRGSVDPEHNGFDTPRLPPSPARQRSEARRLGEAALRLGPEARRIVQATIEAHCAHRGWRLLALNVRTTHVHAVIGHAGRPPEDVLDQLKAWTIRRLREAGHIPPDHRPWTRHGSTIYLWKDEQVAQKVHYVLHEQGDDLDGTPQRYPRRV